MSRSYEYSYELERLARQRIRNARINSTTEQYYQRYKSQYERMVENGYDAYIPDEMSRLKRELASIRTLMSTNASEARDLSFEVGSYIRSMSSMAGAAVEEFDRAERMRVEQLKAEREERQNNLMKIYYEILRGITNPIVVNFSVNEMQKLKDDVLSGAITSESSLRSMAKKITESAESKAEEWKTKTIFSNKKKDVASILDDAEERLKAEKIENGEKATEFANKIQKLRESIDSGVTDFTSIENEIAQMESDVDDTLITEEVRRETVKAIIKQLRSQEFTVEKPQIVETDGKSYVKIIAQRPSGKRAVCNVDLHGKIAYKFDNYEGMTCLKDIEKFNVDLEQIYSVKLSDERVLWSNPDKLSKDAEPVPKNNGRNA